MVLYNSLLAARFPNVPYSTVNATMTRRASKLSVHPPIRAPQRQNVSLRVLPPYSVSLHISRRPTCNSTVHALAIGVSLQSHSVFYVSFSSRLTASFACAWIISRSEAPFGERIGVEGIQARSRDVVTTNASCAMARFANAGQSCRCGV
jgi:hypothetical protein